MAVKNDDIINAIKMLGIDMIENAKSGHPGITLGASSILYSLYFNILNTTSSDPKWLNRDRFILSPGHGSALLYSMLHFAGYDLTIDDLKRYRSVDSFTPGHPELNPDMGIECATGPLGQGIASAVGVALGERYLENICKSYDNKSKLVDFYTYVLCSDGDLQEGISYEALSFASKQKLNKLIVIYDSNNVQLDGDVENTFTEEIEDRFDSLDFNIIEVKNGYSVSEITKALKDAKKTDMPSIVIVNTKLGKDSSLEGSNACHGKPLGKEEVIKLKQKYNLPLEPFEYDESLKDYVTNSIIKRVSKKYSEWKKEYEEIRKGNNNDLLAMINLLEKGEFYIDFDSTNYQINEKYCEEQTISNQKVMNFIAPKSKLFLGGTADVANSTKVMLDKTRFMDNENPTGRNIAFGVREHAMGAILNGMSLLGLRTFGSCYLAFSDYLKPAIRMSALMQLPVTYVFTHDSATLGYDGATHEPIEQLASLRAIPNINVFRPADINELIGSWEYAMKNKCPNIITLTKEKLHILSHTNGKYVKYGAYIVRKEKYRLDGILVATGAEVSTAINLANTLFNEGLDLRVVSMPCVELFLKQNPVYEEKLLPKDVKTITIEAGSSLMWHRFASNKDCALGIDTFGVSGSKEDVLRLLEFDENTLLIKIRKIFESD